MSGTRDRPEPRARVLAATREELVRADAKATALFATTGVAVGTLLAVTSAASGPRCACRPGRPRGSGGAAPSPRRPR